MARLPLCEWVAHMADPDQGGKAPATVAKNVQVLNRLMCAVLEDRLISAYPVERLPLPRIEREEMRFLAAGEVSKLADTIDPRIEASRSQPSRSRPTRHEQVVEPGPARPQVTPCPVKRERHCRAGRKLRRQLCASVGIAGANEKHGQILHRWVMADDHRTTDVAADELQPTQKSLGTRVVDRSFYLDPRMLR